MYQLPDTQTLKRPVLHAENVVMLVNLMNVFLPSQSHEASLWLDWPCFLFASVTLQRERQLYDIRGQSVQPLLLQIVAFEFPHVLSLIQQARHLI